LVRGEQPFHQLALQPGGQVVLTVDAAGTLHRWHLADGRPLGRPLPLPSPGSVVSWSPDGSTFLTTTLTARPHTLQLWDPTADRAPVVECAQDRQLLDATWSADSRRFATLHGPVQPVVKVWDREGKQLGPAHDLLAGRPPTWDLSPDGSRLLRLADDDTPRLFDVATGKPAGPVFPHRGAGSLALSPDGRIVLTGGPEGVVRSWDAATGEPRFSLRLPAGVGPLVFNPSGERVSVACVDGTIRLWEPSTGEVIGPSWRAYSLNLRVVFSPDSRTLISFLTSMRLTDATSGYHLGVTLPLPTHPGLRLEAAPRRIAFSPDGRSLLQAHEKEVQLVALPPALEDDVADLVARAEAVTGLRLDREGNVVALDPDEHRRLRRP
jgi:WD40 repeat protein